MKFMNKDVQLQLSQRINRLRWWVPILAFLLVLTHQLLEHTWLAGLPRWQHFKHNYYFTASLGRFWSGGHLPLYGVVPGILSKLITNLTRPIPLWKKPINVLNSLFESTTVWLKPKMKKN